MRAAKLMQFIVEILFKAATSSNNSHDQDYNVVRSILFCALWVVKVFEIENK